MNNETGIASKLEEIKQEMDQALPHASQEARDALLAGIEEQLRSGKVEPGTTSAGRVGSRAGKVSELTVIAPLKPGGADRLRSLFKLTNGYFGAADRVGTVHDMRFVFLPGDEQMLFATAFDGDWDSYIDDFATQIPVEMDLLFSEVEGWPGIHDPSVKDFIVQYQHTASGWYVASPDLTVADTRRAQRKAEMVDEFLDKAGSL
jgi:hypothetical protein